MFDWGGFDLRFSTEQLPTWKCASMKFKQNLSLLFWLYRDKASKDGKAPIYVRITIDGTDTDISLGKKIHPDFWNSDAKLVTATTSKAKIINMKIVQAQAEIDKHFLVLQSYGAGKAKAIYQFW